jgi:molybdate transport system permease protein
VLFRSLNLIPSMFFLFATLTYLVGFLFLLAFLSLFLSIEPSEGFKEFFSAEVLFALKLTLWTSIVSTAIVMLLAIPTSYSFARFKFPFKDALKILIDLPMFFPELLIGLLLLLLFSDTFEGFFKKLHIQVVFTEKAILLAEIFVALPFAVKILYTTFLEIDKRYESVARSLGYTPFETFFKVSLPMAKHGLISALVVAFARSFGAFGAVLIFAGGVYMKTETLPIGIFLNISYGNLDRAIVMGIVLVLVSLLTLVIFEFFKPKTEKAEN